MTDQVENSEMTDQGEKIYGEFILASNYTSFNTVEDFLATNLPESSRNTLSELDQNVQKEGQTNLKSEIQVVKQREGQINKRIEGQNQQMNKEALEKFLTGNVFHNCTFNFG
ncbi:26090_t:CDS:1, partial [Racocetra persica]